MAIKADVMSKGDLLKARDAVLEKWGTVDCIVNGAGGNRAGAVIPPDKSFSIFTFPLGRTYSNSIWRERFCRR